MSLYYSIYNAYQIAEARGWNRIYILLDVHGTIAVSNYTNGEISFIDSAVRCLRKISKFKEIRVILWTSSYKKQVKKIVGEMKHRGIRVDSINKSLENNSKTGDFRKKPYFSFIIDDKAGFDPKGWPKVVEVIEDARSLYKLKK